MSRYHLTKKTKKMLETRGYKLICKICDCPILVGDEVESKQQRRGKSKLYHATCYDKSMYDFNGNSDNGDNGDNGWKHTEDGRSILDIT